MNEKLIMYDGAEKVDASMYHSLVESLIYLTIIRPDIFYVVSIVSRLMSDPDKLHYATAKKDSLQGTENFGIKYTAEEDNTLSGYTDCNWAKCIDHHKSTSSYAYTLGLKVIS